MVNIDKKELDKILKIEGKVRGAVFYTDREYVLLKWQKKGFEQLKKNMKSLNLDIPYEEAKAMEWYPIGKRIISLLLIKETFGLKDEQIREIGLMAPKFSAIVKIFFKLFTPVEKFSREIPRYWQEHYTIGRLETKKISTQEKIMILHLKDIKIDPLFCLYLEGYFERVIKFLYPEGKCRETKCSFKEGQYHEYYFTW